MYWTALSIITLVFLVFFWFLYRQVLYLTKVVKTLNGGLVDDHVSGAAKMVERSPNKIVEEDADEIEFSEDNPLNLPKDVKIEVEGEGNAPWEGSTKTN